MDKIARVYRRVFYYFRCREVVETTFLYLFFCIEIKQETMCFEVLQLDNIQVKYVSVQLIFKEYSLFKLKAQRKTFTI